MFDIQTEAYLRRTHSRDDSDRITPMILAAIGASLALWTIVLIASI
ncbi:hypothetical protein [Paracoccus sp. (in: a-proteobacteria)]